MQTRTLRITDIQAVPFPKPQIGPQYGTTLTYKVNGKAVEWLDVQYPDRGWLYTPGLTGRALIDGAWRDMPDDFVRSDALIPLLLDVLGDKPLPRTYPDREITVIIHE